jgi:PAS domain S-box-containing protein
MPETVCQPARILVVEDEGIVATDIERCLEDSGFEVAAIAASADDALLEASRHSLDLVLMDIRIQGDMDGIEAGHRLHQRYGLPIVYLTAHGDRDTIERAKKTEPHGFLLKPFKPNELASAVEIALNRVRVDKEILERERSLAITMDAIGDAVLTVDAAGFVRFVNRAAEDLTGWKHDDALGRPIGEIVNVVPERTGGSQEDFRSRLGLGEHDVEADATDQFCIVDRSGARRWIAMRTVSMAGPGSKAVHVAVLRDITRHKETERALRRQADLLDQSLEPILTFDPGGSITYWNHGAELLYGYASQEVLGRKVHDLLHTTDASGNGDFRNAAVRDGQWRGELHHTTKDGRHIVVESLMVASVEPSGRTTVLATNRDITERKRTEDKIRQLNAGLEQRVRERTARLEDANKELEAFAYSVSHDLRAPLRGIDGWSLALEEDYGKVLDERAREYLGRVRSEAQRMAVLIDDLLALSRVGRADMTPMLVNLSLLAEEVAQRLREAHPGRAIDFVIQPEVLVTGDLGLLEVVLTNLLGNAVKFTGMHAQARIEFGTIEAVGETRFFVRDNGVGFDMAHAKVLFAPFQRLHKISEFPGTGIGLATVQRVISRHSGRIWAEATPRQGATFFFTIGVSA